MSELVFESWPKIPRWAKDTVTVTEKIDGTNAAVIILPYEEGQPQPLVRDGYADFFRTFSGSEKYLFATQSRKRFIKPGKDTDNAGFAAWAWDNAEALIELLGYGKHYGEWWGRSIQRGYNLDHKKFSLFRPWRYEHLALTDEVLGLDVVPTLYTGGWDDLTVCKEIAKLEKEGSKAAPGFMRPEGLIIQSALTQSTYKAFTWDDGRPKSEKEGR